ncbi:MAG: thiamine pyrophosphate-binding protein [Alphaproteobacteria bacterium]|nr:thiamine pyrophosphate-binding protein [Alphaproteobacteria bacterium]
MKVSDYIMKRLKEVYNVDCVFMVSGGGAMHLNDSVGKYLPYICNHHEQACAIAAEGYARVNQKLAVANITTGPGGLNCLNGVMGQWTDSVPVLYLSGQVKFSTTMASCSDIPLRQLGDQEVDIISVVKPLTKYAVMVTDPKTIKYHLDKAIYLATHGRFGPVWLDIPLNIQAAQIDENELISYNSQEDTLNFNDITKQINDLQTLLAKAKRPLFVAGHGIRLANAQKEFINMVNKLNIPTVTTMNGFDIITADNPNFIARIGTVANRAGNFALQNADLVITIGSRNNIRQVSYNWENFAKNADLVCIDIDKAELDKPTVGPRTKIKIWADCKDFINQFSPVAQTGDISEWNKWCHNIKEKYLPVTEAERVKDNPMEPYALIHKMIKETFEDNEIVVGGNGTAFLVPFQVGEVKTGQRYIWNSGDASMGYDLPAAIGACCANGFKRTVCLAGDGSIMMNLQELQTIKHYNLPIKIFVFNNDGYISIQQTQKNFFAGRMTACTRKSGVTLPDFIKVAQAFDLPAIRIDNKETAIDEIKKVMAQTGPVLCEIMVSPGYIFAPKLSAKKLPDGTMISPSLEDLYPFLDRKELEENMI